jgi:DNA polymerase III sliding clamp (beta) subunit (PCNA family)
MKIEVAKPDLEAALQVASIGSASTGSDLTTHFVFRHRDEDNGVEVLSNNNRIGCSMPIQGLKVSLSDDSSAFTVESWRLNKWISAVEDSVLTLELKDGVVKATSPKGSVKFQSLDPGQFSYWDKTLAEVTSSTTVNAKRLQTALSHVKLFISDKDTTQPKLAVTEIKKSALQATDKGALALVALDNLDESNIRVHGKDLGQVLAFLSQSGDEDVEIKEHDRCLFLVRHDGGVLSVGRPPHAFPDINIDRQGDDPHFWDLRKEEVISAINALAASASKEDTRVTFSAPKEGIVGVSMTSASGEKVSMHLEAQSTTIPAAEEDGEDTVVAGFGSQEDAPEIPKGGFGIAYPYLLKLLGQWQSEIVRFGINPQVDKETGKSKGGWVRFREDRDGDSFLTLLVWLV